MPTKKKPLKKTIKKTVSKDQKFEILRISIRDLKHHVQHLMGMLHYERGQRLDIHEQMRRLEKQVGIDINHVHERINKFDPEEPKASTTKTV